MSTFLRTHQSVPKMDVSLMSQVKAQASCSARVKLDSRVELHRLEFHSEFTPFNSTAHAREGKSDKGTHTDTLDNVLIKSAQI